MKTMKRLACVVLALVMTLAMGITAFAAEGKSDLYNGETYTAYKIFDATINGDKASYSIDNDSAWLSDVKAYTGDGLTLTETADKSGYLVTVDEEFNAETFAAYLATKTSGKTSDGNGVAADKKVSITGLADGYYLVTSTAGNVCQLTTAGTLTVVEKNTIPDVEKDITNVKDAYAQVGDVIGYTITVNTGTGSNKAITLKDTMSSALTLDKTSFAVKVDGTDVDAANYEISYPESGETFKIVFAQSYINGLADNTDIVVTYSATLNANAVTVDKINNTAKIDYSNQTDADTSSKDIETNSFAVKKYAADDTTKANLAGATFQLKQGDNVIGLIKIDDDNYRVALSSETEDEAYTTTFTTVAGGNIVIKGVDSDVTYTLVETSAPAGYNLLTTGVSVKPATDNSTVAEIENESGSTLPTTGGMGTTVLYTIGAALVLGAGVLLVVRRRMSVG